MVASSSSKGVLVDAKAGFDEPNFEVTNYDAEKKEVKKKKKTKRPKKESSSPEKNEAARPSSTETGRAPRSVRKSTDREIHSGAAPTTRTVNLTKRAKKKRSPRTVAKPQQASPLENPTPAAPPAVERSSQRHMSALARDVESMVSRHHHQKNSPQGSATIDLDRMELGVSQMASRSIQHGQPAPYQREKDSVYVPPKQSTMLMMGDISESTKNERYASINDDVYNMLFLSRFGGLAFFYAAYVFLLKMALYSILVSDVISPLQGRIVRPTSTVLAVQFLILPVAVAMQEDLIATFHLIANIKYCPTIKERNPDASQIKFNIANIFRGIDGTYSLTINYIVLLGSQDVLSMFLNFAALQFLQRIDNVALHLAADGHLSRRLEVAAKNVNEAKLLTQDDPRWNMLDTVLFCITLFVLLVVWILFHFL